MLQLSKNVFEREKTLIECTTCEDYKLPYKIIKIVHSFLCKSKIVKPVGRKCIMLMKKLMSTPKKEQLHKKSRNSSV